MRVESLLNFALDEIQSLIPRIEIVETEEDLEKNPNQIHLRTKLDVGEIEIRVDQINPEEQVMRVWGGNHDASPNVVIHVNGDESWRKKLKAAVNVLQADPYLCIPDED